MLVLTGHCSKLDVFQWTNSFQPGTELYEVLSRKKVRIPLYHLPLYHLPLYHLPLHH